MPVICATAALLLADDAGAGVATRAALVDFALGATVISSGSL